MRRVAFLIFPGFELLDLSGPAAVFSMVEALGGAPYETVCFSPEGSMIKSGCGVEVSSRPLAGLKPGPEDTVLIMGAEREPLRAASRIKDLGEALVHAREASARVGSICTGAFLLAATGLLDGRQATTHWAGCAEFAKAHPRVLLRPEALYVEADGIWTSAGAATGIDMALQMLKRDRGAALMGEVARRLVVYAHRPGGQSQFSSVLAAQTAAGGVFAGLIDLIDDRLHEPLTVAAMADRMGMSERSFYRKFVSVIGETPAQFVDAMRLDRAKRLLEAGAAVKTIAAAVGFRSEGGFRAAFVKRFGLSPSAHRAMHSDGVLNGARPTGAGGKPLAAADVDKTRGD